MIDADRQLRDLVKWKQAKERPSSRLGSLLEAYVTNEVSPKYQQFCSVEQAWQQVVPDDLAPYCRCESISNGQLKIVVASPVYMYKLQTMSSELLERLGQLCRRPKIRKIKFVPKP